MVEKDGGRRELRSIRNCVHCKTCDIMDRIRSSSGCRLVAAAPTTSTSGADAARARSGTGLRHVHALPRWGALRAGEPERLVCSACAFVFFLDPKLAAGCIFEVDGGIVLLRRAIAPAVGKWVFPGGYVDRGEAVSAAAAREVLEEVCLRVVPTALLGV
jgi:NADH pyrophosphatase NudC (nudix superfamily)